MDNYVIDMGEIIIEAALPEENVYIRPGQVTVFDREDIEASGALTLADIIERAPGISVSRQGGILEPQSVSIRGGASDQVLILVDGKPSESLWSGGADPGSISVGNIERIEIIRGAAAALYGEGAFSGVINIITSGSNSGAAEETEAEIEYGYASFNTHLLNMNLKGPINSEESLSGMIAAGALYTGGEYEYNLSGDELVRSNNDGWTADISGGLDWNPDNAELSLSGGFYASERGSPGLMEFLTPSARMKNIRGNAGLDLHHSDAASGVVDANIDYSYKYSLYTNSDEEINDYNDNNSLSAGISWLNFTTLGDVMLDALISGGYAFDYLNSNALTDSTGSALSGDAFSHSFDIRARLNIVRGSFDLTPAAGVDLLARQYTSLNLITDSAFSWSAAAGWAPYRNDTEDGPVYIKVNAGTGYKNPSFQDLFWPSGALASGNPDLLPEHSLNFDGGIFLSFFDNALKIESIAFITKAEDLIQWLPSAGGVWKPVNIGTVINGGAEISVSSRFPELIKSVSLDLNLVYNWLKSIDSDPLSVNYGCQLAYRPEHSGNISVLFSLPNVFTFELSGNYLGWRYTNNANTKYIDQVILISAAASWHVNEIVQISASVDNILDQVYIDRLGYPVTGAECSIRGRLSL
jgi:outer membrane cobalamin receptor